MKSRICLMILAAVLSACTAVTPSAVPSSAAQELTSAEKSNRVSLYLGQRDLDKDDYDPVDEQGTIGLEYAHEPPGSPVGFEVGVMGSRSKEHAGGFEVEGKTGELYGGIRKSFGSDVVRPYIGAGIALINSKVDVSGAGDDDDSSAAGYAHAGINFDITPSFGIGLDLRFLFGSDMTIAGVDTDADYGQLALVLGFAF